MKTILYIAAVIVIIVLGVFIFIAFHVHTNTTSTSTSTPSLPVASSTNTSANSSNGNLPLTLKDGSVVTVPDFTKTNQPATANAQSGYQVAGSNTGDFQILYYPQNSGFIVSLFTEPLGQTRLEAEQALRQQLGLSDAQLCKLTLQVGVPNDVNEQFSGENLGLSFCPGAVSLP